MLENYIRPTFQKYAVDPFAKHLARCCHPNTVTIASLVIGLLAAVSLFFSPITPICLLLLSGYCDVLDGSIARIRGESTPFGTMLDILSDRLVESFIIIAIFLIQPNIAWVGLLMMMSIIVCVSSFLLVGIFSQQQSHKSFYYSAGLMERAETFIFFIIMMYFPSTVLWLGVLFTLLVLWTTFYRVRQFYLQAHKDTQS